MNKLVFHELDNETIWNRIVDKTFNHIILHRFNPNYASEWWKTTIHLKDNIVLNNVLVNQMTFDVQLDLETMHQILTNTRYYLFIYQFDRKISGKLDMERLPAQRRNEILRQNGLRNIISIDLETTTVCSFDDHYLERLKRDDYLSEYLQV